MGGETWINQANPGYSSAQRIGNQTAYLQPNSQSMQNPKGGRFVFAFSGINNNRALYKGGGGHTEQPAPSQPPTNPPLYKGAIVFFHS